MVANSNIGVLAHREFVSKTIYRVGARQSIYSRNHCTKEYSRPLETCDLSFESIAGHNLSLTFVIWEES